ncbi:hypothetical protein [Rhizobium sp. PL01]|uniref:hypothetical protein n=1 Tax=Rhizobium sp. PL01 TaxID=3085631 RepID=UPI002980DCFA|nr:hypothetical protein [Rhizobium sp. PL01]MDW5316117.1 hypothetical protein [Rhizobium sp. PL01]
MLFVTVEKIAEKIDNVNSEEMLTSINFWTYLRTTPQNAARERTMIKYDDGALAFAGGFSMAEADLVVAA